MKKQIRLTKEEHDLNARIDRGEFESILTPKQAKAYTEIARNTFAKQRTVNVRISERNLLRLKAAAAREGVSYQTLITSLIQKHV